MKVGSNYLDWTTRKLKRRYWKAIKAVWRGPYMDRKQFPYAYRAEEARLWKTREEYKAELKRRGWDV